MTRARLHISWWLCFSLLACDAVGNIGTDPCAGHRTRCDAPTAIVLTSAGPEQVVATSQLATLAPTWRGTLPDAVSGSAAPWLGGLLGNPDGLWAFRGQVGGERLELYELTPSGEVLARHQLAPPSTPPSGESNDRTYTLAGAEVIASEPGPALRVRWARECESFAIELSCEIEELVRPLADGNQPGRQRIEGNPALVLPAADEGAWMVEYSLKRLDARGVMRIDQPLINSRILLRPRWSFALFQPLASAAEGLWAVTYDVTSGRSLRWHLWLFDEHGSARRRFELSGSGAGWPTQLVVSADGGGSANIVWSGQDGQLTLQRLDAEEETLVESVRFRRDGYTPLWLVALARDGSGTFYLLTTSGEQGAVQPTLCRVPRASAAACYLVPEATGAGLVAGEPGVVYAHASLRERPDLSGSEGRSSRELVLLRYAFMD